VLAVVAVAVGAAACALFLAFLQGGRGGGAKGQGKEVEKLVPAQHIFGGGGGAEALVFLTARSLITAHPMLTARPTCAEHDMAGELV